MPPSPAWYREAMPELPEVETVVRSLRASILGARLAGAEARFAGWLRGDAGLLPQLAGTSVRSIARAGKYILIDLAPASAPPGALRAANSLRLLLHLGMSGKILVEEGGTRLAAHTHFILRLADGREVRFIDARRFGRVAIGRPDGAAGDPSRQVASGAEPLEVDEAGFLERFWKRSGTIKGLLLNQTLLRGLGNIYVDESLFRARIHPRARRLSRARLRALRTAIRQVLSEAIAAGGSSISDYVASDGQRGWFQVRHRVYGRAGQPCRRCRAPIRRLLVAGRGTHVCPRCQRR